MSNPSVSVIRVPSSTRLPASKGMAKRALLSLFKRLDVGHLHIHDGGEEMFFGEPCPDQPGAVIKVHDQAAYGHVLRGGTLGAGESYMQGHWSSPDPVAVIRFFSANMQLMQSMDSGSSLLRRWALKLSHLFNRNTPTGSKRNISAHYDLGNEFFELFLDSSMMYSAAVFPSPEASLAEAAVYKLDLLCQQLQLEPDDHLLEIGTGWGGMALHAAKNYGCRVTTTTISREQYDYALARVRDAGLEGRITVLCEDYRALEGQYDKLVSIEMIEAVGHQWYQNYFARCSGLLKPGGLMALQAITIADQRYREARDSVDFIKRYIFPGGCLPSVAVISEHVASDTDMQIVALRDITLDYARTLASWRQQFLAALPAVREQGFDEMFERMWEFYLCYCEGGFRERIIGTVQLTLAKPGYRGAVVSG
jgi:cyclopropane-fatty-acyl-phospholipid synthase